MSNEKIRSAAAFSKQMREQKCTTAGHEDTPAKWLIERDDGNGQRWVCDECLEASR